MESLIKIFLSTEFVCFVAGEIIREYRNNTLGLLCLWKCLTNMMAQHYLINQILGLFFSFFYKSVLDSYDMNWFSKQHKLNNGPFWVWCKNYGLAAVAAVNVSGVTFNGRLWDEYQDQEYHQHHQNSPNSTISTTINTKRILNSMCDMYFLYF